MENSTPTYSFYLPLQILVIFICIWMGYQVFTVNQVRVLDDAILQQVIPQADASLAAKKRLLDLAQDLLQVAPKSPAATQIVKEFDIHVVAPDASAAPAKK